MPCGGLTVLGIFEPREWERVETHACMHAHMHLHTHTHLLAQLEVSVQFGFALLLSVTPVAPQQDLCFHFHFQEHQLPAGVTEALALQLSLRLVSQSGT